MRILSISLILFLCLIASGAFAGDQLKCKACGQTIAHDEEMITIDGAPYHIDHFRCAFCDKPIGYGRYYPVGSLYYHEKCFENNIAPKCGWCGDRVISDFINFNDTIYHQKCYEDHVAPKCAYCQKIIKGKAMIQDNVAYHPDCYENYIAIRCPICGELISGNYINYQDTAYHKKCYEDHVATRCAYCLEIITDSFTIHNDLPYHYDCYKNNIAQKCPICNKPVLDDAMRIGDSLFHNKCYRQQYIKKCDLCGKDIEDEWIVDYWGNRYHSYHIDNDARCTYCRRFISEELTGGGHTYPDGRQICNICFGTAVQDSTAAFTLMAKARKALAVVGIDLGDIRIPLKLISLDSLKKIREIPSENANGYCHCFILEDNYHRKLFEDSSYISILYGLPQILFLSVYSHELLHAWHCLNGIDCTSAAFREGSCNYASRIVLEANPGIQSSFELHELEEDPSEIYGEGYRRVCRLVDSLGINGWLQLQRESGEFPEGF